MSINSRSVNEAARLQSTADPDTIQVNKNIYDIVNKDYNFETKENVYLKNIGTITTYNIKL